MCPLVKCRGTKRSKLISHWGPLLNRPQVVTSSYRNDELPLLGQIKLLAMVACLTDNLEVRPSNTYRVINQHFKYLTKTSFHDYEVVPLLV